MAMFPQSQVFPYYRQCVKELEAVYRNIRSRYSEDDVKVLCELRGYPDKAHRDLLEEMNIGTCQIDSGEELGFMRRELGLVSDKDNFLLNGRYIVPIYDHGGNLCALVGYYPDQKRYVTTPSPFFSKECLFFNFAQAYELSWREYNGFVILVEGIFDCLSLRSVGLPAIATMGSSVSEIKGEYLKLFRKVLGIPDDDRTGRRAFSRFDKNYWHVPYGSTMLRFIGGEVEIGDEKLHCKDMDNFVTWFDEDDVRDILLGYADSREAVETFSLE